MACRTEHNGFDIREEDKLRNVVNNNNNNNNSDTSNTSSTTASTLVAAEAEFMKQMVRIVSNVLVYTYIYSYSYLYTYIYIYIYLSYILFIYISCVIKKQFAISHSILLIVFVIVLIISEPQNS